jgi:putative sugar O-methyltransferase
MNKSTRFKASKIWSKHSDGMFSDTDIIDLNNFRQPGTLNKYLSSWDPYEDNNYRYYKNIVFNLAISKPDIFFKLYNNIGNTDLGNPINVKVKGYKINLDYIFSVQEILFCFEVLNKINSVLEIGAGFGRTCHSIIRNFSRIDSYTIVDIPACLKLTDRYLSSVLTKKEHSKIIFISNEQFNSLNNFDLALNIDSFQEMEQNVINNYLSIIDNKCNYFFTNNTICKYEPKTIGMKNINISSVKPPLDLGLCTDVIDIFNDEALKKARKIYIDSYKPGSNWSLLKEKVSEPWQYYHSVLYSEK